MLVNNMKKRKKLILWVSILLIVACVAIYLCIRLFNDDSRLTPNENEWINSNLNKIQNVSVVNNTNVFGYNGTGVFYDFLTDFSSRYGLKVNSITYNANENVKGIRFMVSNSLNEKEVNFYKDHYILVSKENELYSEEEDLVNRKVGILGSDLAYVSENISRTPTFVSYNSREELLKAFESGTDIQAILVPRMEYIDVILSKNYFITYHFSHIYRYYNLVLDEENESMFSSILKKSFQKWEEEELSRSISNQEFQTFVQHIGISQTDIDRLKSISYHYGFIHNSPYEILSGGNFGGIVATYLNEFSKFGDLEFDYKRYKNNKSFVNDVNDQKINVYFGFYTFNTNMSDVSSNLLLSYDILLPISSNLKVSSLKALKSDVIYVEENSILHARLSGLGGLKLKTYQTEKELKKIIKEKSIIAMDHNVYLHYQSNLLKKYSSRYQDSFELYYNFKVQSNDAFVKLFSKYVDYLDENEMLYQGIYNYERTLKTGAILSTIARYILYILLIVVVTLFLIYRSSRRVRLVKKIRKEDKMKFIDQLTSLKNRNYLNENLGKWNKNSIYPQSMIVIDLDRIQDINDKVSYEQGDEQIKSAANILVKTQLDNSDIMRTDGNEFMIYLVGYQSKQISAFIHKLNKEFKNLPYEYGASIGYSMIVDDIKSIEDAINEAIEDVRKQKESKKEENKS